MPSLTYNYLTRAGVGLPAGGSCGFGTVGAALNVAGPFVPTWAELGNAANALAVQVGPPWDLLELQWRARSYQLALNPLVGAGQLAPSPLVLQMDATEKGQLSYHVGTAAGLALARATLAPGGGGAQWWEFHLSRFLAAGGQCNFVGLQRPDLMLCSVTPNPGGITFNYGAVWECKGHAINAGPATLGPALNQSLALTAVTALPGYLPFGGPIAPAAWVASKIDVFHGNYRLQVVDPADPPGHPVQFGVKQAAAFYRAYYGPRAAVIRAGDDETREYDDRDFITTELIPGYRMGLDRDICKALDKSDAKLVETVYRSLAKGFANQDPERVWVSGTGFSLELGKEWYYAKDQGRR